MGRDLLTNQNSGDLTAYLEDLQKKKRVLGHPEFHESDRTFDLTLTGTHDLTEIIGAPNQVGMNLLKSNSMKKFRQMDTNQLISDMNQNVTGYRTAQPKPSDKITSMVLRTKLNEYMSGNTGMSLPAQNQKNSRQKKRADDTFDIINVSNYQKKERFMTQKMGKGFGKAEVIKRRFLTQKNNQSLNEESPYLKTVVQEDQFNSKDKWGTKVINEVAEEGPDVSYFRNLKEMADRQMGSMYDSGDNQPVNQMGEIMMNDMGEILINKDSKNTPQRLENPYDQFEKNQHSDGKTG